MDWQGIRTTPESIIIRGIAQGTVDGSENVNVSFLGTTVKCRAGRAVTTAAGDIVLCIRTMSEIVVIERLFAAAPTGTPDPLNPPPPEAAIHEGTTTFLPVETRSHRSSGWRQDMDDLLQSEWGGDLYTGCAFYGSAPRSLAGATVTDVKLSAKRVPGGSSEPRMCSLYRIDEATKPAGAPTREGSTFDGPTLGENESTTSFDLPNSFGQDLIAGDSGGLAIWVATDNDPHVRLAGRQKWGQSMALKISWTRTA